MDPDGTFIVDVEEDKVNTNLIELIEKGVYQGAFILLESGNDSYDFQIRGRRFKISFLFSILYNLPLRNYTGTRLSKILRKGTGEAELNQTSLFN